MALGIVNDDVFESELKQERIPVGEIKLPKPLGKPEGTPNTPDSIRKLIGDNALTEGRPDTLALADALGISSGTVSAYTNGATSLRTYDKDNPLKDFLAGRRRTIAKRASSAVLRAIEGIDDEKLSASKAVELASIAKALSGVVKDMLPEEKNNNTNVNTAVKLVVHVPQQTKEESFDVITVNES
jgi:hypothetical protein